MLLIGLDAAAQRSNIGYAVGQLGDGRIQVEDAGMLESASLGDVLENRIAQRLRAEKRALVAVDAPLGWPAELASTLINHRAGESLGGDVDTLFNRETDRVVKDKINKKPLDVGADKIARVAHTALRVLADLRDLQGNPLPLAWDCRFSGQAVIEVYPAATLKARRLPDSGYKKPDEIDVRRHIARELRDEIPELEGKCDERADIFDACLCLVAAKDFIDGVAIPPGDMELARREGWIWVRNPAS